MKEEEGEKGRAGLGRANLLSAPTRDGSPSKSDALLLILLHRTEPNRTGPRRMICLGMCIHLPISTQVLR